MDFVRPIYIQGGKVLLVEFDYTLKMFPTKEELYASWKTPNGNTMR